MDNKWQIFALTEETEHLAIIVEELFLAGDLATTEGLFLVLDEFIVVGSGDLHLGSVKAVLGGCLGLGLWASEFIEEFSCVLISVRNTNSTAMDTHIKTHTEVLGHEGALAVTLQDHLAVEELSLGHARVNLLGLNHKDGLVLKEIVDEQRVDSKVLETALNN